MGKFLNNKNYKNWLINIKIQEVKEIVQGITKLNFVINCYRINNLKNKNNN